MKYQIGQRVMVKMSYWDYNTPGAPGIIMRLLTGISSYPYRVKLDTDDFEDRCASEDELSLMINWNDVMKELVNNNEK